MSQGSAKLASNREMWMIFLSKRLKCRYTISGAHRRWTKLLNVFSTFPSVTVIVYKNPCQRKNADILMIRVHVWNKKDKLEQSVPCWSISLCALYWLISLVSGIKTFIKAQYTCCKCIDCRLGISLLLDTSPLIRGGPVAIFKSKC